MKASILPALLIGIAAANYSPAAPQNAGETNSAMKAVKAANKARTAALAAGDIDKYLQAYEDDAVWIPPHSPEIVGREVAAARIKPLMDQVSIEIVGHDDEHVATGPDWIAERGRYVATITPKKGGDSRQDGGNFMMLWHRGRDGVWRISWEMWTSAQPVLERPEK